MNLKKFGKRMLYFIGGILLTFISSVILAVYIEDGGAWISQGAIYIYLGIIFGIGLFITSFDKNIDNKNTQKAPDKKPNDTGDSQSPK